MAANRHIDRLCLAVTFLAVLLTFFLIKEKGVDAAAAGSSRFAAEDFDADWETSRAVRVSLDGNESTIDGGGAYFYDDGLHIVSAGKYVLAGELNDGSVIVDADKNDRIWILLNGVSVNCDDSAAILVEQAGKVFLTLAPGTENVIDSGGDAALLGSTGVADEAAEETDRETSGYNADAVSAGIDGTIYARDDLTINGTGVLTVSSGYRHGIVCNDDLVIAGGTIAVTAAEDGIHANDSARFAKADVTISAGDDAVTVSNDDGTGYIYVESGSITVPSCYEGLEAANVEISGGVIDLAPQDDGINASGSGENVQICITGGDITIVNANGRDADGLDSNGDIHISGGSILISVAGTGGNCALDCGSETGGICEISGGTIIACGGNMMAEGFDASSKQKSVMYNTSAAEAGAEVILRDAQGTELLAESIPCSFTSVIISTPQLQDGEICTLEIGGTEAEVTVGDTGANGNDTFPPTGAGGMEAKAGTPPEMQRPDGIPGDTRQDMEQRGFGRQWDGQPQDAIDPAADAAGTAPDPETLILTGISALILLAGILFAAVYKR